MAGGVWGAAGEPATTMQLNERIVNGAAYEQAINHPLADTYTSHLLADRVRYDEYALTAYDSGHALETILRGAWNGAALLDPDGMHYEHLQPHAREMLARKVDLLWRTTAMYGLHTMLDKVRLRAAGAVDPLLDRVPADQEYQNIASLLSGKTRRTVMALFAAANPQTINIAPTFHLSSTSSADRIRRVVAAHEYAIPPVLIDHPNITPEDFRTLADRYLSLKGIAVANASVWDAFDSFSYIAPVRPHAGYLTAEQTAGMIDMMNDVLAAQVAEVAEMHPFHSLHSDACLDFADPEHPAHPYVRDDVKSSLVLLAASI